MILLNIPLLYHYWCAPTPDKGPNPRISQENGIIRSKQHAFMKHLSCYINRLTFYEEFSRTLHKRRLVDIIYVGFFLKHLIPYFTVLHFLTHQSSAPAAKFVHSAYHVLCIIPWLFHASIWSFACNPSTFGFYSPNFKPPTSDDRIGAVWLQIPKSGQEFEPITPNP